MEKYLNEVKVCEMLGGEFKDGNCIIPKDKLPKTVTEQYDLYGFITVTDWYGGRGWKKLHIITNKKGLEDIKKNPLQDYIGFGVQSVDYAELKPMRTLIISKPLPEIKAGKYNLSKKEEEAFADDWDVAVVRW